jgi:hypothetical protein
VKAKYWVKDLGVAIVEPVLGGGYHVMTPEGEVTFSLDVEGAAVLIAKWQSSRTPKDGAAILRIEWRGCRPPDGVVKRKAGAR